MNQLSNHASERPLGRWRSVVLASLILCAGFAVPSRAGVGGGETVGTLPNTGGGTNTFDFSRAFRDPSPAFFLEGRSDQIYATVLGWTGRAIITQEIVDASTHIVRFTFHGDLRLDLDRHAFEQGLISIGWAAPQTRESVRATLLFGTRTLATGFASGRNVLLPVLQMDTSGGLDVAPLTIIADNRQGLHASLAVIAHGDTITLSQNH
jgi:hypothetical protein